MHAVATGRDPLAGSEIAVKPGLRADLEDHVRQRRAQTQGFRMAPTHPARTAASTRGWLRRRPTRVGGGGRPRRRDRDYQAWDGSLVERRRSSADKRRTTLKVATSSPRRKSPHGAGRVIDRQHTSGSHILEHGGMRIIRAATNTSTAHAYGARSRVFSSPTSAHRQLHHMSSGHWHDSQRVHTAVDRDLSSSVGATEVARRETFHLTPRVWRLRLGCRFIERQ